MRILIAAMFISLIAYGQPESNFPNQSIRSEIATKLFDGIEEIDAMTYEVRNKTRDIDWTSYRTISTQKIMAAKNWDDFYQTLSNVHFGIINRHSFVLVNESVSSHVTQKKKWPKYQLGYTWPEVDFFALDTMKSIRSIAGYPVKELFHQFFNFYCNDAHQQACLARFVKYIGIGYFFEDYREQIAVTYMDGSEDTIQQNMDVRTVEKDIEACSGIYRNLNLHLKYESQQVCLFTLPDKNVLKIRRFANWGADYSDIYCVRPHSAGMCSDINYIKSLLSAMPEKELLIDLQGNGGGSEITPWVAALTRSGFYDNRVQYKNIRYLHDADIRENAFYYSGKAENWYQNLDKQLSGDAEFLPERADFCRGSDTCKIELIKSARYPISYTKLKLITDQGCVSSCDDFVWRLKAYANATVYGQPPATDGAYARLRGYIHLLNNTKVELTILGDNQGPPSDKGELILSFQIPISRTVSSLGKMLEGDPSILDVPLPVTKENYLNINEANVRWTIQM